MLGPSMTAAYTTRVLVCLACRGGWVRGSEVLAACSGVPRPYLVKTLHGLARRGLVETRRGSRGGYRLARDPREITLFEILAAVDGAEWFERCLLGLGKCSAQRGCPMHPLWSRQRARLEQRCRRLTLRELAAFERWDYQRNYRYGRNGDTKIVV